MLHGEVKPIQDFSVVDKERMFTLMNTFYENMDREIFLRDFHAKDYCLVLYNEEGELVGFTTQKVMEIPMGEETIHGIFSGDTIIHKDYWGDLELFRVWADFWFHFAEQYEEFYWFLICKGYKTYRMLPVFWEEFYPNPNRETPARERAIIDAYARTLYPTEYNPSTGVVEYSSVKDRLKEGVADIGEQEMKRKDIAFFCQMNPGHVIGNDLACLARIDKRVLKKKAREILFHES